MIDMLIYWAPLLIIFFGMIILGLIKHNNKKLFAISIAWLSLIIAGALLYGLECLLFSVPVEMQDFAIDVTAGIIIAVFFLPIVICIFLYIQSIRKKNRNDALLIGTLAWGLLPVFVWLYVLLVSAIIGGDPCP